VPRNRVTSRPPPAEVTTAGATESPNPNGPVPEAHKADVVEYVVEAQVAGREFEVVVNFHVDPKDIVVRAKPALHGMTSAWKMLKTTRRVHLVDSIEATASLSVAGMNRSEES
jgi:hypothetical protein